MSVYLAMVHEQKFEFPDYRHYCPLCGGKNCAVRIGFYYRRTVIIDFDVFHHVPIARWMCCRKGALKSKHRTFSLLPHPLIPYHQHALNIISATVNYQYQNKASFEQTKEFISASGKVTDIPLENKQICDFHKLFIAAFSKLITIGVLKQKIMHNHSFKSRDPVARLMDFIEGYKSPLSVTNSLQASTIEKLALDFFFHFQTGHYFERHFLFGTPTQKNMRRH